LNNGNPFGRSVIPRVWQVVSAQPPISPDFDG
jgi:hypothetical protein